MRKGNISTRIAWWWYLVLLTIDSIRGQNLFGGGGFLPDPFLELTAGDATSTNEKSSKLDSSCISNGALIGSIIATLLLCTFVAFLTWMIYLRQKLKEVRLYKSKANQHIQILSKQNRTICSHSTFDKCSSKRNMTNDRGETRFPLDVTECKSGTFPFRQSQVPSIDGHYSHADLFNKMSSSFHSDSHDQDVQMLDIELLSPTFCGLNFSITGNMRSGIFVKDILDKESSEGRLKLNSSDELRTGDRIVALTISFQSIVYEDALTILSYASPYPVILRIQRPIHLTKSSVLSEERAFTHSSNKVKWLDGFDHYDNDTHRNRSIDQRDPSTTLITDTKSFSSKTQSYLSSKKDHPPASPQKSSLSTKGNKLIKSSNNVEITTKCLDNGIKIHRDQTLNQTIVTSTGLTAKPINKISTSSVRKTKPTMKSVTNAVISYLHYRDTNSGNVTDETNQSEGALMPYYDSPYDYYGAQLQTYLNRNNNNNSNNEDRSFSNEPSVIGVTSVYTLQLSSTEPFAINRRDIIPRRCERRISAPAVVLPMNGTKMDVRDISLEDIDTVV